MALLSVSGLSRSYRSGERWETILDGLELEINQGEVVLLLGPSGSGKTTLLNLIAGLDRPDAGEICMGEQRVSDLDEEARTRWRREHLGVVFQFFNLIPTLTVAENLLLPLCLVNRSAEYMRVEELLLAVGLQDKADQFPDQLSGGEQQRAAICRALIHDPGLLLADEPTGSLDNRTAEAVIGLMIGQVRAAGQALLLVTHNRELVPLADRVLHLHRGRLQPWQP